MALNPEKVVNTVQIFLNQKILEHNWSSPEFSTSVFDEAEDKNATVESVVTLVVLWMANFLREEGTNVEKFRRELTRKLRDAHESSKIEPTPRKRVAS